MVDFTKWTFVFVHFVFVEDLSLKTQGTNGFLAAWKQPRILQRGFTDRAFQQVINLIRFIKHLKSNRRIMQMLNNKITSKLAEF